MPMFWKGVCYPKKQKSYAVTSYSWKAGSNWLVKLAQIKFGAQSPDRVVPANENPNLLDILAERYGPEIVIVLSIVYIKSESSLSEKALYRNFLGLSLPSITCWNPVHSWNTVTVPLKSLPSFRLSAYKSTGEVCRGRGQYLLHCYYPKVCFCSRDPLPMVK